MSGGSGGGSSKTKTVKEIPIKDVPQVKLKTTGFGGMGYQPTPQTYTTTPTWMQGAWDVPNWGTTSGQLTPQTYTQPETTSQGYDLQALIDQLTALTGTEEETPKNPRTMSTKNFLKAYLLKGGELSKKIREYDEYQYEKAQGRR